MGETPIFDANLAVARARIVMPDAGFSVAGFNNEPGQNLGSLALLGACAAAGMTVYDTLSSFGEYSDAVMATPNGDDHQNIRALQTCDLLSMVADAVTFNRPGVTPEMIETLWEQRDNLVPKMQCDPVEEVLRALDTGRARIAYKDGDEWQVNQWLKQAVLLSFRLNDNELISYGSAGGPAFDKVARKFDYWTEDAFRDAGIRVVPGAAVRHSAFIAKSAILMPCFINLGAYVGENTMIDTWATVGSCAQIGKNCHISGGAGIGGVLEPLQANPVIIEDNCFIGARSEVAEGVIVGEGAVLSMGVFLGASTKIIDRATGEVYQGRVPPYSVVVPGSLPGQPLPDGSAGPSLYCAVIVKTVDEQTRAKTSVNELLRD